MHYIFNDDKKQLNYIKNMIYYLNALNNKLSENMTVTPLSSEDSRNASRGLSSLSQNPSATEASDTIRSRSGITSINNNNEQQTSDYNIMSIYEIVTKYNNIQSPIKLIYSTKQNNTGGAFFQDMKEIFMQRFKNRSDVFSSLRDKIYTMLPINNETQIDLQNSYKKIYTDDRVDHEIRVNNKQIGEDAKITITKFKKLIGDINSHLRILTKQFNKKLSKDYQLDYQLNEIQIVCNLGSNIIIKGGNQHNHRKNTSKTSTTGMPKKATIPKRIQKVVAKRKTVPKTPPRQKKTTAKN
jgi:hypothetical protein